MTFDEIFALLPPLARFIYYLGAITFAAIPTAACALVGYLIDGRRS